MNTTEFLPIHNGDSAGLDALLIGLTTDECWPRIYRIGFGQDSTPYAQPEDAPRSLWLNRPVTSVLQHLAATSGHWPGTAGHALLLPTLIDLGPEWPLTRWFATISTAAPGGTCAHVLGRAPNSMQPSAVAEDLGVVRLAAVPAAPPGPGLALIGDQTAYTAALAALTRAATRPARVLR